MSITLNGSSGITTSSTGNSSIILDAGTGSASANQESYIDFKLDGTLKSTIKVTEATTGNPLEFHTGGAQRMIIDSSGNVGIGNSTPSNNHTNANNLVVGNGTAGGIANYVGTGLGWYAFSRDNANNTDAYDGGISYDGSRNLMFHTNAGSERMRIDGSGNVGINKTSLTGGTGNTVVDGKLQIAAPVSSTALRITRAGVDYGGLNVNFGGSTVSGGVEYYDFAFRPAYASGVASSGDVSGLRFVTPHGGQVEVVVNENSNDVDFRVESANHTDAIVVNAAQNSVNFFCSGDFSPGGMINIDNTGNATNALNVKSATSNYAITATSTQGSVLWISDDGANRRGSIIVTSSGAEYRANNSGSVKLTQSGLTFDSGTNYFDDYEEGTFTPTLSFGSTTGTTGITYGQRQGKYVKIGKTVHVMVYLFITNKGTDTGHAMISGLPFTASATAGGSFTPLGDRGRVNTGGRGVSAYITNNNYFLLYSGGFDGSTNAQVNQTHFTTNSEVDFNFTYITS